MSNQPTLWVEDPDSDSHDYVAQSNIGGWSRISSHPVVPVELVGTLTIHEEESADPNYATSKHLEADYTGTIWAFDLPPGKYLIVPLNAGR